MAPQWLCAQVSTAINGQTSPHSLQGPCELLSTMFKAPQLPVSPATPPIISLPAYHLLSTSSSLCFSERPSSPHLAAELLVILQNPGRKSPTLRNAPNCPCSPSPLISPSTVPPTCAQGRVCSRLWPSRRAGPAVVLQILCAHTWSLKALHPSPPGAGALLP